MIITELRNTLFFKHIIYYNITIGNGSLNNSKNKMVDCNRLRKREIFS
jgi:hypothetical protein